MSLNTLGLTLLLLVALAAAQDDAYDEAHECDMFRKCRDCSSLEYCVKLSTTWLQRWWVGCPPWAPYCNPYAQRCEATITPICQSLLPTTPAP